MEHSFNIDIACEYGVPAAIILKNLHFWIEHNRANRTNYRDGKYWTYNSVKAFTLLIPYYSRKQIINALKKIEDAGLIITGNYNDTAYDRTTWYTLTAKGYDLCTRGSRTFEVEPPEVADEQGEQPDEVTDTKGKSKKSTSKPVKSTIVPKGEMHSAKREQCIVPKGEMHSDKREHSIVPKGEMDLPEKENGLSQKGTPIPDNNTYNKPIYITGGGSNNNVNHLSGPETAPQSPPPPVNENDKSDKQLQKKSYGKNKKVMLSLADFKILRERFNDKDIQAGIDYLDLCMATRPDKFANVQDHAKQLSKWAIDGGRKMSEVPPSANQADYGDMSCLEEQLLAN